MKRALAYAPALACALVILWLGSQTSIGPPLPSHLDKLGHFTVFAVLGALLAFGAHHSASTSVLPWLVLVGALVGALDELHQRSVPGRSAEWADLAADVTGCAVGLWLTHRALVRRGAIADRRNARDEGHASHATQEHRA